MMPKTDAAKLAQVLKAAETIVRVLKSPDGILHSPISFMVISDCSDPHRVHVLDVTVDSVGISINEQDGNNHEIRQFEWDDLMLLDNLKREIADVEQELEEAKAELRFYSANDAPSVKMESQLPFD